MNNESLARWVALGVGVNNFATGRVPINFLSSAGSGELDEHERQYGVARRDSPERTDVSCEHDRAADGKQVASQLGAPCGPAARQQQHSGEREGDSHGRRA